MNVKVVTSKDHQKIASPSLANSIVPLPEALVRPSLPPSPEIVATDISRDDNGGASGGIGGGRWDNKEYRNKEREL